jgi:hypothetical protein
LASLIWGCFFNKNNFDTYAQHWYSANFDHLVQNYSKVGFNPSNEEEQDDDEGEDEVKKADKAEDNDQKEEKPDIKQEAIDENNKDKDEAKKDATPKLETEAGLLYIANIERRMTSHISSFALVELI